MFNKYLFVAALLVSLLFGACDSLSTDPGSFVVVFQWEAGHEPDTAAKDYYIWAYYQEWKGGEGKEFPADIETNAKSLDEAGPVQLGSGESLNFTKLTYGSNRFVRAAVWDNAERTGDPLYIGISELFNFSADDRNKPVAVNMKLQANAGVDETGEAGSFAIEVRYDGVPADRVPAGTVTLRFTVKNADTVIIANDLNFEKGPATLKLTELAQIDDTTYEYGPWDITTGWEGLGDTTYSVFGKSRNTLGYESDPQRADVYLDTTAPLPNITPFPEVAKLGDTITVRFSFDEAVLPDALVLDWGGLAFVLADNKGDRSYTYTYTVDASDDELARTFTLTATDRVGNTTAAVTLGTVTIDRTPPSLDDIVVDTGGKEALRVGDILTVSFTASEELPADPLVKIDDRPLTLGANEGFAYTYTYTVTGEDITGIKTITAGLRDMAGNDATVGLGTAVFDLVAPQLVNPIVTPPQAKEGAVIRAVFSFSEAVVPESLSFDGDGLTFSCATDDDRSYSCTHTVASGDAERLYTLRVTAADRAGNAASALAVGSTTVDRTPASPTVPSVSVTTNSGVVLPAGPAAADGHIVSAVLTMSFDEPLAADPVLDLGGYAMTPVACAAPEEGTYCYEHTADEAEGEGIKFLSLSVEDRAGNITVKSQLATVVYDLTGPRLVSALFERTPNFAPARDEAGEIQYYSIRDPYTNALVAASLTLYADEEVAAGPTLAGFDLGAATVNADEVYYTKTLSDADAEGLYVLTVSWVDLLGNAATRDIPWRMAIDKSEPARATVDGEKATFTRKPWGTADTAGLPAFSLTATTGAVTDGSIVLVQAIAPNGLMAGSAVPQSDGSFSMEMLTSGDVPVVYLDPVKRSGLRIAYAAEDPGASLEPARHVVWRGTLNGKVPYSTLENPLVMVKARRLMPQLDQGDEEPTEQELQRVAADDGIAITHTGGYSWRRMDEGSHPLLMMAQQLMTEMVMDPNSGKVYSFGGWYWTGAAPGYGNPTDYISNLYTYDLNTDRADDPDPNGNKPGAQAYQGLLFDDINDVLVLFGGGGYTPTHNDLFFYYPSVNRWYSVEENGPLPPARQSPAMAHDRSRDRYIVWGGTPDGGLADLLADMWEYDRSANAWIEITQSGTVPSARQGAKMVYDARRHRLLLFGGQAASGLQNDLHEFDIDTATWYALSPSGTAPAVQMSSQGAYDGRYQKFYLFGGVTGTGPTESDIKQNVYEYDIRRNEWSLLATTTSKLRMVYDPINSRLVLMGRSYESTNYVYRRQTVSLPGGATTTFDYGTATPTARFGATVVYNKNANQTYMYGGTDTTGTLNELWRYDHASNQWTKLSNSGWPGLTARVHAAGTFDLSRNSILIHGGVANYYGGTTYSDFVEYSLSSGGWNQIVPTGSGPGARSEHAMAYDEVSGKTYIFGGGDAKTFIWNPGNPGSWSEIAAPVGLASRTRHTFIYMPNAVAANRRFLMYGGYADTQLWALSPATNTWSQLDADVAEVGTRTAHAMAYDSDRGKALLFGGSYTGTLWDLLPNTTWTDHSYLDGDPSARNYARMVYSPADKAAMVFHGNEGNYPSTVVGDWYRLDTGYNSRATLAVSVPLSVLDLPADASIDRIEVTADAAGRGYSTTCTAVISGATLHGWHYSGWRSLAANTATYYSPADLSVSIADEEVIRSMTRNRDNRLYLALTPTAPARCGSGEGQIVVDYFEAGVSYRIGDRTVASFDPADYHVATVNAAGWHAARAECLDRGMDLVVVGSEAERQFLETLDGFTNSVSYWVGLTDSLKADDWRWVSGDVVWKGDAATGRPLDGGFNYWRTGYPATDTSDCVLFTADTSAGGWLNSACDHGDARALCERPRNKFHHQFDTTTLTYDAAETACVDIGGHLAVIDNELDQMSIEKYQTTNLTYWLGLDDLGTEGTFLWKNGLTAWIGTATGVPHGYTNWADGQPNNTGDGVTASGADDFRWNDVSSAGVNYYTCEMPDGDCGRHNAACETPDECCDGTCEGNRC